ncbi:MAG: hypothetical protein Fur005_31680 [Roseiflexaceae bacterium]
MTRRRLKSALNAAPASPEALAPTSEPSTSQIRSLLAETQALSARLAALHEIATSMQSNLEPAAVFDTLAREARWVLDFQYCSLAEVTPEGYIERVLTPMPHGGIEPIARRLHSGDPISDAIQAGHAILISSLAEYHCYPAGMQSGLILTLRSHGEIIGTLNFFALQPNHYRIDDLRIAGALAAQAAVVLQNTRLFAEVTEARDELHTMLESISDGVIVIASDKTVLLINRAARLLLGLPFLDDMQPSLAQIARHAQSSGKRLFNSRNLADLRTQFEQHSQGQIRFSDGRSIEWRSTAITGSTNKQAGYVVSIHDITARVQLDELRNDMIAMLVHDLRTPLTTMLLSIDMQSLPNLLPEEYNEMRERTRQGALQMLRQVNTLLDLRKLEAGRLELVRKPTDIAMLFQTVINGFQVSANFAKIRLEVAIPSDAPLIMIDSDLISRVLENLIGNAIKFTDAGGTITLSSSYDDRMVILNIEDTGIGIPAEMHDRIFEKFTQVAGKQQRKGTGLGLAFCKLVAEAHHGQIGVRENPKGGSIFWIKLPRIDAVSELPG